MRSDVPQNISSGHNTINKADTRISHRADK